MGRKKIIDCFAVVAWAMICLAGWVLLGLTTRKMNQTIAEVADTVANTLKTCMNEISAQIEHKERQTEKRAQDGDDEGDDTE